ncbi:GNAT family N-acetyltransferase [Sulfobacillus harzensis]|uniref:GNAT family N-acetyltransferase n=1 Tax=Sulfobacillus harzensis TaxID=2729629 RepID=A0A7Y0Q3P1_9FIRM|nr:GNAT family N-acetyltransferase [Sulfobacillus harzensis]NMP23191.1 GNAT family N-acetyltransferase [Sulfobacillus harzensis]
MAVIETERLYLRRMHAGDLEALMEIFSDPVAMQYYPRTRSRVEVKDWIHWTENNYRDYGVGLWIVESKDTGTILGQCGIIPQAIHEPVQEWEVGYLFIRRHWGHGYATEAARACRDYAFTHLAADHAISIINPLNQPSIKVAERNGMTRREVTRWRDHSVAIYQITREAWQQRTDSI